MFGGSAFAQLPFAGAFPVTEQPVTPGSPSGLPGTVTNVAPIL
jgi:hypothetical protein